MYFNSFTCHTRYGTKSEGNFHNGVKMQFKSLELNGFKSFVDQTTINFSDGFTAIVGPNGCGKSNISDAIRWVLGEQRPKTLRGAKMEDFIFSGSASRKPSGMAEASITITDIAGKISRPELAEYNEVTVTRRLYRSGESEYLINKTVVRLKDVVDLFLDTGISTRAFSIIEQDQVQKIVTSNPENRRFIVEEAAGIMKYKHRRHQAMLKLESSTVNLERVTDIINELQRQKNSLKRQANKAERYKKYRTEMNLLFLATSADELKKLKEMEQGVSRELARLEEVRASMEADISSRQNRISVMQSSLEETARKQSGLKEEEYRLGSMIERNEENIKIFKGQAEEASRLVEKLGAETLELSERTESMEKALKEKREITERLREKSGEKSRELESKKDEFNNAQAAMEEAAEIISSDERKNADVVSRLSELRSNLASHKTRTEMLDKRESKNLEEINESETDFKEVTLRVEEMQKTILSHQEKYETATAELDRLAEQKRQTENAKSRSLESVTNLKTGTAETRARLESLKDIEKSREGYQKGTRALLEKKENSPEIANLMRGSLVDKIKVAPQYEAGLETFLGDRLQALLINSPADAATAIEILRGGDLGRGTFLPLETVEPMPQDAPEKSEGVLGLASDLVETSEELRPLMQRLLMNVVFVKDIETALRLRPQSGFTYVTPRGDIVDRSGVISGGSAAKSGVGLLERKRMIDQLTASLAECERRLEEADNEQARISENLKELESALEAKKAAVQDEELALVGEKKEMESLNSELKRHESSLDTFRAEARAMEIERDILQSEVSELEKSIETLARDRSELEEKLETARQRRQAAGIELATLQEALYERELELTSIKGEENMALAEQRTIEEGMEEITGRLQRLKDDIASNADRKSELEAEIVRLKDEIHQGLGRREDVLSQLARITDDLQELQGDLAQKEDALKEALGTMDVTKESINQARIKESETTVRLSSLIEKAHEHGVSTEEMENCDTTDLDAEEAGARLGELREAIAKIGDVNMTAIEEYNSVDERLTFLTTQRDDLLESINDIKKVIEKLNRTTRSMFEETFVLVRENFRQIFSKLFNGGQADMILTDETNMLESGIEIFVQPPGKKKQNINLLSAGEKAMTAISILFSVFMVKPSPFCLLDEVDAPLDETNIVRFKDILREFSTNTQFLVITHNQKTMAFADRLYGISMQEPGISKILSVDLVDTYKEYTEPLRVVHG